jgi:hypothetical protein
MYKALTPRRSRKTFRTVEPGYFTELIRKFNFPPDWSPQTDWGKDSIAHRDSAVKGRENLQRLGRGSGTVFGLSDKADALVAVFEANKARRK